MNKREVNEMNYVNLCVMNINEGGEVYVENKMEDLFLSVFLRGFVGECLCEGDVCECEFKLENCSWGEVSLEEGLSELDDYYFNNGNGMDGDERLDKEYRRVKEEFKKKVEGREGRFYLWGGEYDYELFFVEEKDLEELMNVRFDDDGY